jgi:diamine N-acetyltransferase
MTENSAVRLKEITPQNFRECINLKVSDGQENFVASNLMSIAQAKIYPTANPYAVYAGDKMVGFVMYGYDTDDERFYLVRLMIGAEHQGKGYGKATVLQVIERMSRIEDCREIYLSFVPENVGAERLYKSVGFERTGEISEDGETVMRFDLSKLKNNLKNNELSTAVN